MNSKLELCMGKYNFCFVVIGFGTKPSYATGTVRMLDLNQTYTKLIKPVFDELGIKCQRACDMNVSGSIDQVMIKAINESDIVICDITCLNANALWALGVRHALKNRHTILISDVAHLSPTPPFDVSHHVIHAYILYPDNNSLFGDKEEEILEPFSELMGRAEKSKKNEQWEEALSLFDKAKDYIEKKLAPNGVSSFVECRRALCTYKGSSKDILALGKAMGILEELEPKNTSDPEVLGLSGAINKRIFEIGANTKHLEDAVWYYERGFSLVQDYYNGINAAFMLYKKASIEKLNSEPDWEDTKIDADSMRNKVLKVSLALESAYNFKERNDVTWIYNTIAEAYNYKNDKANMEKYELLAKQEAEATSDKFAVSSYNEQKAKIEEIKKVLA